jgi:hypothetical protein
MAKKDHSEEQILRASRQAESGTRVSDICRGHGTATPPSRLREASWGGRRLRYTRVLRVTAFHPTLS